MRVKALTKIYYNRSDRNPGEEYEMDEREEATARLLQTLGKIEILPKVPKPGPLKYQTAAMQPQEEPAREQASEPASEPVQPMTTDNTESLVPRRYRRRDMKAQE